MSFKNNVHITVGGLGITNFATLVHFGHIQSIKPVGVR